VFLVVWQLIANGLKIASYLLPTPTSIWDELAKQPSLFVKNGLTTLGEIATGYPVAVLVGVVLGVMLALSKSLSRMLYPLIVWAQSTPKIAIAPLLLIWFGFGLVPKVLLVAIEAFFPVVVNTAAGFLSIEPEMMELSRILGLRPAAAFFKIRVPHSLPYLFTGFKIAATGAVAGAIVAEYVSASGGLGYLLVEFQSSLNSAGLVASAAIIGTMGVVLFLIVAKIEDLVLPWHVSRRGK
jgi:NitT/TauT family transport system permease protein